MEYNNITIGSFIARPNRFVAHVEIVDKTVLCHVKNTSRLTELLVPGVRAAVQREDAPGRKTPYSLIAVEHEGHWVNIDSQAPNKVFGEWILDSGYFGAPSLVRPETTWGHSRFDYYIETGSRRIFAEVKGVTLVEGGVARFPGAPTTRGVKHLQELVLCQKEGYEAVLAFIVKRHGINLCGPNDALDPAFGEALREAHRQGVNILALGCAITPGTLFIDRIAEVLL